MRANALALPLLALGLVLALGLGGFADPALLLFDAALAVALALLARRSRYATFALRLALGLPLLTVGALLFAAPDLLAATLGLAWLVGGAALVLGLLTPWTALYAALLFPAALRFTDTAAWPGFALAALALALADSDVLALDAALARRGGLFPAVRHEVVLEESGKTLNRPRP